MAGADVFIGVSAPNVLDGNDIATMADGAIVFAMANPDPEVFLCRRGERGPFVEAAYPSKSVAR